MSDDEVIEKLAIIKRKAALMKLSGEMVCMSVTCDGICDTHSQMSWALTCRSCGVTQRRENTMWLRVFTDPDRACER